MSLGPNAGAKPPVVRKVLEPPRDELLDVRDRPQNVAKQGVPFPPVLPVGVDKPEKLHRMLTLDQPQLNPFIYFVEKHLSPGDGAGALAFEMSPD
jgi:hypothetical protein